MSKRRDFRRRCLATISTSSGLGRTAGASCASRQRGFLCFAVDGKRSTSDPTSCSEPRQTGNDVTAAGDAPARESDALPGRVGGRRHSDEMQRDRLQVEAMRPRVLSDPVAKSSSSGRSATPPGSRPRLPGVGHASAEDVSHLAAWKAALSGRRSAGAEVGGGRPKSAATTSSVSLGARRTSGSSGVRGAVVRSLPPLHAVVPGLLRTGSQHGASQSEPVGVLPRVRCRVFGCRKVHRSDPVLPRRLRRPSCRHHITRLTRRVLLFNPFTPSVVIWVQL